MAWTARKTFPARFQRSIACQTCPDTDEFSRHAVVVGVERGIGLREFHKAGDPRVVGGWSGTEGQRAGGFGEGPNPTISGILGPPVVAGIRPRGAAGIDDAEGVAIRAGESGHALAGPCAAAERSGGRGVDHECAIEHHRAASRENIAGSVGGTEGELELSVFSEVERSGVHGGVAGVIVRATEDEGAAGVLDELFRAGEFARNRAGMQLGGVGLGGGVGAVGEGAAGQETGAEAAVGVTVEIKASAGNAQVLHGSCRGDEDSEGTRCDFEITESAGGGQGSGGERASSAGVAEDRKRYAKRLWRA